MLGAFTIFKYSKSATFGNTALFRSQLTTHRPPRFICTEERNSLLGGVDAGSCSDLSANLCEIEESEAEEAEEAAEAGRARHTDV